MTTEKQKSIRLGDAQLLKLCVKESKRLGFLSGSTLQILRKLNEKDDAKKDGLDFLNKHSEIDALWVQLVIDAIHALKIRDRREKAGQTNFQKEAEKEQQLARDQNVFGIVTLKKYFKDYNRFESVLFGIDATYRDHVTHVIRVWLTGIALMCQNQSTGRLGIEELMINLEPWEEPKAETAAAKAARSFSAEERWAMWTLVALCHDLGYPLEKTRKVNAAIERMLAHFSGVSTSNYRYSFQGQHQVLNDITLDILSSKVEMMQKPQGKDEMSIASSGHYATPIQSKYRTKFAHSLEDFRHGIISCLVLMKTLVFFMETDYDASGKAALTLEDARQFCMRSQILRAIASHTCSDIYHLRLSTLPFLLIICDELQEWGRPTFREMKMGLGHSSGADTIQVDQCDFGEGVFSARLKYQNAGGPSRPQVISKFEAFHKLLRAALADKERKLKFTWEIVSDETYRFEYDSTQPSFKELNVTKEGKPITSELYQNEEDRSD